jgi:chemotaxis protein methyltransferase CheR
MAARHAGLDLRGGKEQLVETRLSRILREASLTSFDDYCDAVATDATGHSLARMIEALTTNHTSFLREPAHFDFLRTRVLPERREGLSVWSAGCSTGEEPYTIASALLAHSWGANQNRSIRVVATDISQRCLAWARAGRYSADRVRALPHAWVSSYFEPGAGEWGGWFQVRPEVRAVLDIRRHNLLDRPPPAFHFDVIFCRNVMIYMGRSAQERIATALAACLKPGGYLFVGHAESLRSISHGLAYVQPSIYQKASSPIATRGEKS